MHVTSTETLPEATRQAGYYLPKPLPGGPMFAFGGNVGKIDFSKMSPETAANMVGHGIEAIAKMPPDDTAPETEAEMAELGEPDELESPPRKRGKKEA